MYKWREIADNLGFAEHSGAVYAVNAGNRRQRQDTVFSERLAAVIELLELAEESEP
jgi:hypothetical protein